MTKRMKPSDKLERKVDKQVENTFPASDPYSVGDTSKTAADSSPVGRRPPLIDKDLVRKLATDRRQPCDKP